MRKSIIRPVETAECGMDEGFWEKETRDEMRRRADAIGAKVVMYYLDTPIETIRERVVGRNNNLTKESFKISREMLDNYLKDWEPPTEAEDYTLASEGEETISILP